MRNRSVGHAGHHLDAEGTALLALAAAGALARGVGGLPGVQQAHGVRDIDPGGTGEAVVAVDALAGDVFLEVGEDVREGSLLFARIEDREGAGELLRVRAPRDDR